MVTDVFLNQKRANVREHMTKMASLENFLKVSPGDCERGMADGEINLLCYPEIKCLCKANLKFLLNYFYNLNFCLYILIHFHSFDKIGI